MDPTRFGSNRSTRALCSRSTPWEEELATVFRAIDYGDVAPVPGMGAVESMLEMTESAASHVFRAGASLLTLRGDHTLPYGPVRAAAKAFGKLALVHLDSHQDSLDSDAMPGGRMVNHGTFATELAKEGRIDPTRSAQLYIRTFLENPSGYTIHYAEDARQLAPEGSEPLGERPQGNHQRTLVRSRSGAPSDEKVVLGWPPE